MFFVVELCRGRNCFIGDLLVQNGMKISEMQKKEIENDKWGQKLLKNKMLFIRELKNKQPAKSNSENFEEGTKKGKKKGKKKSKK